MRYLFHKIPNVRIDNLCHNISSRNEILPELAQSQACYERGEGEDFGKAFDE